MARATTRTLIPLDRVAQILGIEPLHFNGVVSQYGIPERNACDDVWFQYNWQNSGKFSREDLAYVLHQAEEEVSAELGYYPIANWIVEEEHEIEGSYRTELYSHYNTVGDNKSLFTRYGYVLTPGVRAKTLIQAGVVVVYTDDDLDGYSETATVTVATTVTDREEISVYYPLKSADDAWEIRPVDITISGGIAIISFPRAYVVVEDLIEKVPSENNPTMIVDGDVDANFLSTVDVYRVYTDTSQQATFYSNPTCDAICAPTETTACMYINDSRRGILSYSFATWDAINNTWVAAVCSSYPFRSEINYRAGLKNNTSLYPHLRMDPSYERHIIYYALTLADRELCGCNNFQNHLQYLTEDLAKMEEKHSYQLQRDIESCPFGTKRAAVDMWRFIKQRKLGNSLRKGR